VEHPVHLVKLPKVNENMSEATLAAWLVPVGARVDKGAPIASILTDKAEFELEADAAGVMLAQAVPVKSTVPVGAVLAAIGEAGEKVPDLSAMNADVLAAPASRPAAPARREGSADVRATPAARKMAKEAGVNLAEVANTAGGVVREEHVKAFMESASSPKSGAVSRRGADAAMLPAAGVIGIGIDIAEVPRIKSLLEKHPVRAKQRLFTESEVAYCESRPGCTYQHFAGRFAVKEAVFKALGTGWGEGVSWKHVEVWNRPSGAPGVRLKDKALERFLAMGGQGIWVSLSHTDEYAAGVVVMTGKSSV
jgi:holo-[acyl-carrier protein] synthase